MASRLSDGCFQISHGFLLRQRIISTILMQFLAAAFAAARDSLSNYHACAVVFC